MATFRSRAFRKAQIIDVLRIRLSRPGDSGMTMYAIARKLYLSPSTKLMNILKEMVTEDTLTMIIRRRSGCWDAFLFNLKSRSAKGHFTERSIPIKTAGAIVGQMEMWS